MFQATIVSILSFTKALMISPSALRLCDDGCCGRLPRARPTGQHIDPDENAGGDSKKVSQTAPTDQHA